MPWLFLSCPSPAFCCAELLAVLGVRPSLYDLAGSLCMPWHDSQESAPIRHIQKVLCTHVRALCAGWAGGLISLHANLLEQTKQSVVVVTNNRGVFMAGRVGCLLPALAGFIGPASAGPCRPGRFSPKGVPPGRSFERKTVRK